jgi:hypothetical protein
MTSQEIDPRTINTIPCPQCHLHAVVHSTEREVVELDTDDYEGMSEGQIADYEGELAMGGGANWTELVESATCGTCHVTLIRRTLGGVETVQIFDTHPVLKARPAIATEVTRPSTAPKAKPVAKKRTAAAARKAKPAVIAKKFAAKKTKKTKPSKPKVKRPKAQKEAAAKKAKPSKPKAKRPKARKAAHK